MNETNSIVLAAAKAIRTRLEYRENYLAKINTRVANMVEPDSSLADKDVVEVTIKTNLPGREWMDGNDFDELNDQCQLIGQAFGCRIEVDDNGLRGHRNRLEVTVSHA
jgi:hypothetical protein